MTPVYYHTAAYARENGELELFRQSHRENVACRNDIQETISRHFDGMHLNAKAAGEILDRYGAQRVSLVLAVTVEKKWWDGRFSAGNRTWAQGIPTPEGQVENGFDRRDQYVISSHPAVLDGFIRQTRDEIAKRDRERNEPVSDLPVDNREKVVREADEKKFAVMLTDTQEVYVLTCDPSKGLFDTGRKAIGCEWIEIAYPETLDNKDYIMMIDEEGKIKPGGSLVNVAASEIYGTKRHGDPIMGNAMVIKAAGERLELLTAGEAKQLASELTAIRDKALDLIAEIFAKLIERKTVREAAAKKRRQPCKRDEHER